MKAKENNFFQNIIFVFFRLKVLLEIFKHILSTCLDHIKQIDKLIFNSAVWD